ncbi:MAG: peptide-methionine (S)-S-oxide reductase MsrA [Chlorobi bacterium]|nr:peptide-methionine (S)-S-oxide reductase MsrA [Chlorobiota bacterium]
MNHKPSVRPRVAVFAGGCFWCTEAVFKELEGVLDVIPGYTGGRTEHPTYEQVSTGETGHAEAVMVLYDPERIGYDRLLEVFFATHDPTQLNRQGNDIGTQYRSAVFYTDAGQEEAARAYIRFLEEEGVFDRPVVTEVVPASVFWPAEDYHKNYLEKHPENPYCRYVIMPKLEKFRRRFGERLKRK